MKGHHVYKSIWTPVIGQELQVKPEDNNEHDKHTISVIMGDRTVGHLPRTTSRECAMKLVNLFVEKQVMLPATLPDIESEILCCKDILFTKIT